MSEGASRSLHSEAWQHMVNEALRQAAMNPSDHNVEDVIRGVRAIAKALRTTPAQVHELRERQGLPTFLSGKTLCSRWDELAAWLERQARR